MAVRHTADQSRYFPLRHSHRESGFAAAHAVIPAKGAQQHGNVDRLGNMGVHSASSDFSTSSSDIAIMGMSFAFRYVAGYSALHPVHPSRGIWMSMRIAGNVPAVRRKIFQRLLPVSECHIYNH